MVQTDILKDWNLDKKDNQFRYMLLSRMQSDCKYYLGNGNRQPKHLWVHDESTHIETMRALWLSLPVAPEWLTMEQIDEYAKQMNVA